MSQYRKPPLKKRRLFIAGIIPPKTRDAISNIITPLKERYPRLAYEPVEKYHITLKFLGWTSVDERKFRRAFHAIARTTPPIPATIDTLNTFIGSAFILYGNVEDNKGLTNLARRIDESLTPFGFRKETRIFHPHITLARGKKKPRAAWKEAMREMQDFTLQKPIAFTINRFVVMQSKLSRSGSRYTTLYTLALSHGSVDR